MYRRTRWGFAALALYVGLCLWSLYKIPINLGIDLQGGTELTYELDLSRFPDDPGTIASQVKDIISRRLDLYGLKEIKIAVEASDRLVVTLPGGDSDAVRRIREQVEKQGKLTWQLVVADSAHRARMKDYEAAEAKYLDDLKVWAQAQREWEQKKAADRTFSEPQPTTPKPPPYVVRNYVQKENPEKPDSPEKVVDRLVLDNSESGQVPGEFISNALPTTDTQSGGWAVAFQMTSEGASRLGDLTGLHTGKQLAIVLDGEIKSAPTIESRITTDGIIRGSFSQAEVVSLVNILRGGSLAATPKLLQEHTVGPVFGQAAIEASFKAVLLGVILVLITMVIYYVVGGMVADIALVFNLLTIMAFVVCFRQTLTLPGIAGMLLSLGMAVDANILIYEHVREERKSGKTLNQSLSAAFSRVFSVIFDSNLTTVITALVLFYFGTGPVKGFAVTLIAGVLVSFISALFVSRLVLSFLINHCGLKKLAMLEAFGTPKIPFVSFQRPVMFASMAIVVAAWIFVVGRGRKNYGLDFNGGARVAVNLVQKVPREAMEDVLKDLEAKHRGLFLDWSIQEIEEEDGSTGRKYVLLTRTSTHEEAGVKAANAQSPPAPAEPPSGPAGASGGSGSAARGSAESDPAQAVKQVLSEALAARGHELLPPPYSRTQWESAADGKNALVVEANLERFKDLTPDGFRDSVNAVLRKNALFAPDVDSGYTGIEVTAVERLDAPAPAPAVEPGKSADRVEVTRLRLRLSPYTPPAPDARDHKVPTREEVESGLKSALSSKDLSPQVLLCDPFPTVATIGPVVASNLQGKAIVAIFISMLGVIFYMGLRFDFNFGVAAIVATVHDILITIGVYSVTDMLVGHIWPLKFNLPEVAAILTIIGYSINDTIVVFDRIRENLHLYGRKKTPLIETVNLSINQTLSRTLLTGVMTFETVMALLLFGGDAIRGFAYIFLIGLITGTFSSIFVASPVLVWLEKRSEVRRAAQLAAAEA